MTKEEKIIEFRTELNQNYNELCRSIKNDKRLISQNLKKVLDSVFWNIDLLDELPNDELYMALNVIRLARSQDYSSYSSLYNSEIFQKLDESYGKSR